MTHPQQTEEERDAALRDPDVTAAFVYFIQGLYAALGLTIPDEFYYDTELERVLAHIKETRGNA